MIEEVRKAAQEANRLGRELREVLDCGPPGRRLPGRTVPTMNPIDAVMRYYATKPLQVVELLETIDALLEKGVTGDHERGRI